MLTQPESWQASQSAAVVVPSVRNVSLRLGCAACAARDPWPLLALIWRLIAAQIFYRNKMN